jgi:hypothetical protein
MRQVRSPMADFLIDCYLNIFRKGIKKFSDSALSRIEQSLALHIWARSLAQEFRYFSSTVPLFDALYLFDAQLSKFVTSTQWIVYAQTKHNWFQLTNDSHETIPLNPANCSTKNC